ncbi:uncharacterized [Tachysurus ichikawai]
MWIKPQPETLKHFTKTRQHKSPNELELRDQVHSSQLSEQSCNRYAFPNHFKIKQDPQKPEWDKAENLN